jgi:transaldolase
MSLKQDIDYSLWCDFIERDFLEDEFVDLIESGLIHGATSNPAIFQNSFKNSSAYQEDIELLKGNEAKTIYEKLAIKDIKLAANKLSNLYNIDDNDGFVSIEVDPMLCDDAFGTIEEGSRLHSKIEAKNVMIKVPATPNGYEAMRELIGAGISVNATLIFSPTQAIECAKAFEEGIKVAQKNSNLNKNMNNNPKAVISVFVSRFDRKCDEIFASKELEKARLGIINAIKCYHEIEKFNNPNIRTLFASTGVKGEELKPSYYIDELIFPHSVNTAPLATIKAWQKDGSKVPTQMISLEECNSYFELLASKDIDMDKIYDELLNEGLETFKDSFKDLGEFLSC